MVWVLYLCLAWAPTSVKGEGEVLNPQTGSHGIIPIHYDLWLIYDMDPTTNFSFFGVVDIRIKTTIGIKWLTFNASHYEVAKDRIKVTSPINEETKIWMKFKGEPSAEEAPVEIQTVERVDTWTYSLEFAEELQMNSLYSLSVPFSGNMKTYQHTKRGVVCNSYINKKTHAKEYYLMSDFASSVSAISAVSSVFPCFTDSTVRTTISVAILHPKEYNVISNMPTRMISKDDAIVSFWPWYDIKKVFTKKRADFVWDYFETTPRIRLYSLGYLVSKFKSSKREDFIKTKIRIWSRSDFFDQTKYAASIAPEIWMHFVKMFNITKVFLPKIDFVAIQDFVNIGLGFWGLDFFWEPYLYIQEQEEFYLITYMMSVKVANQFFLHLVSMKYLSQSALAEGCCRFLAELVTINLLPVYPSINVDTLFVQKLRKVLIGDGSERSKAVTSKFNTHLDYMECEEVYFNEVSNDKAAILIRMVYMFLGKRAFMEAIRNYVAQYSFNNAEQDDFWKHMHEVGDKYKRLKSLANETLEHVMVTWTDQPGYPLLDVQRDYKTKTLTVTQKRYLDFFNKSEGPAADRSWDLNYSWWIPITIESHKSGVGNTSDSIEWLGAGEGVLEPHKFYHRAAEGEWILLNSHMMALCRINYDEQNWRLLTEFLVNSDYAAIPMVARVQLLSDAFQLAKTGYLNYSVALELSSYLHREEEYQPLQVGLEELAVIGNLLHHTKDYAIYQKYVMGLIDDTYHTVHGMMKSQIYIPNLIKMEQYSSQWACRMNIPLCEENAINQFHKLMATENPDENNFIPPHLRATVYCTAVSRGLTTYWDFVLERARHERSQDGPALMALACAREPRHLLQALELTITEDFENKQHIDVLIENVLRSPMGYLIGKSFIYNRISEINSKYINTGRVYPVKLLVEQITTQLDLDEFLVWHGKRPETEYKKEKLAIEHGIRRARMNIAWQADHKPLVLRELERLTRPTRSHALRMQMESRPTVPLAKQKFKTLSETKSKKRSKAACSVPSLIYLLVAQTASMFI